MGRSPDHLEPDNRTASSPAQAIIIMGVAGSGKTRVGQSLAGKLGWLFLEGDRYHSRENIAKMEAGQPLTDRDRLPWLITLQGLIRDHLERGNSLVLACSALKESYREVLAEGLSELIFVHLRGDYELIFSRLTSREGHYMKAEMLQSQFDSLEPPQQAVVVDIDQTLASVTAEILEKLRQSYPGKFLS